MEEQGERYIPASIVFADLSVRTLGNGGHCCKSGGRLPSTLGSAWLYIFADPLKDDAPRLDRLKKGAFKGNMRLSIRLDEHNRKVVNLKDYDVDPTGEKLCTRAIQRATVVGFRP